MMTTNQIAKIRQYDQSIWMDYLNRSLIESGELEDLIKNLNIRGVTSNPAIFKASIIGNKSYDLYSRLFIKGNDLYMIMTIGETEANFNAFVESFNFQ